jgi:hypothetical protein
LVTRLWEHPHKVSGRRSALGYGWGAENSLARSDGVTVGGREVTRGLYVVRKRNRERREKRAT